MGPRVLTNGYFNQPDPTFPLPTSMERSDVVALSEIAEPEVNFGGRQCSPWPDYRAALRRAVAARVGGSRS